MSAVETIRLRNFRSYKEACLDGLASSFVVLLGPNGAGKTNFLEAVSLLSAGKGLRGADFSDYQNREDKNTPWAISAQVQTVYGSIKIGTGRDPLKERRHVMIQGEPAKSQTQLTDYLTCLWLTPQMDRLFIDASSVRRRFLDRLVFTFDAGHAGRMTRYENALAQRSRLLREGKLEPVWLDGLEKQIAETGVAIAAARVDYVGHLQSVCHARDGIGFPTALLALSGLLEQEIASTSALALEESFREKLSRSRDEDSVYGGAAFGPHRTDFQVTYAAKKMPAAQCSTGEQKALLIGLILAHADLIRQHRGAPPILLLDEVAAHLDENRRADLFRLLAQIGGQVWMTGTDRILFDRLENQGSFLMFSAENALKKCA